MLPRSNSRQGRSSQSPRQQEHRRQIRGLLLLALAAIAFAIYRSGVHNVFTSGWWRLW